jgi:predicted membrane protein
MGRTAQLTSKHCILYIYSTNVYTEYFKQALYSLFFSLQNAVCFTMLTCLVSLLFIFYIQGVLQVKKNNSSTKGLRNTGIKEGREVSTA